MLERYLIYLEPEIKEDMKNYAENQSDVFCSGQTLILGSESNQLLHNESDYSDVSDALDLVPDIREIQYLETSTQRVENEIQNEE